MQKQFVTFGKYFTAFLWLFLLVNCSH